MHPTTSSARRFHGLAPFVLAFVLLGTSVSSSYAQAFDPEQVIRTYFGAAATLDIDTTVSLFAPEGVLEDPVGTPAHRGRKAIREHLESLSAPFAGIDFHIHRLFVVSPHEAAASWTAPRPAEDGPDHRDRGPRHLHLQRRRRDPVGPGVLGAGRPAEPALRHPGSEDAPRPKLRRGASSLARLPAYRRVHEGDERLAAALGQQPAHPAFLLGQHF